jgi:hypothetical protein
MNRKLGPIFILLILALVASACGGGDEPASAPQSEAKATAPPTEKAADVPAVEATQEPAAEQQEMAPEELGDATGAIYVEALEEVTDLVKDKPAVAEVKPQVEELKETYIQKLVELGHLREALNDQDKAIVDSAISRAINKIANESWYATYGEVVQHYFEDYEFQQTLYSFNIIGQYANFDLLKKQEPEEAVRLGIMEPAVAEAPAATETTPPEPTETTPPEPTAASAVVLGEEQRSDMGGFAFQPIPGYEVEESFGIVGMDAPDGDPDIGPAVMILSYAAEETMTEEQLLDDLMQDATNLQISNQREVTIGGITGMAVDLSGTDDDGREIAGRIVVALPAPTQPFTMVGVAPPERWDGELEPLFEAVLASISFFEPVTTEEAETELPEAKTGGEEAGEVTRQWATSATASSEYDDPSWSASQATGAPNTPECGDFTTAWASYEGCTVEWIELYYDIPVRATKVNIIQSNAPDQVVQVELIDTEGTYHTVYQGEPQDLLELCPYTLSIAVDVDYQVVGLKITIDQTVLGYSWAEIDAVELVGYADLPAVSGS